MADADEVVVEGRAGAPLFFALLSQGERELGRHLSAKALRVELENGRTVDVELDARATVFVSLETLGEKWGDLEELDVAAPFRANGPGPHVKVTLAHATIAKGAQIALRGKALDVALDGGGPRVASSTVPTRVRARVLASGVRASADLARVTRVETASREPEARRTERRVRLFSPIEATFAAAALAALGYAAIDTYLPRRFSWAATGIALWLVALGIRVGRGDRRPLFYGSGAGGEPPSGVVTGTFVLFALMMGVPAALVDYPGHVEDGHLVSGAGGVLVAWALALAAVAFDAYRITRAWSTTAAVIAGAPPHASPPRDGAWGAVEGVVVARTMAEVLGEFAPLSSLAEEEYRSGSTPNATKYVVVGKPFVVRTRDGELEVDPSGATWTSTIRIETGKRPTSSQRTVPIFADVVPDGALVRVVGRASGGGTRIAATGAESLFIVASSTPRGLVVRPTNVERVVVLGLIGAALVASAVFLAWHPFLPEFWIPEGD